MPASSTTLLTRCGELHKRAPSWLAREVTTAMPRRSAAEGAKPAPAARGPLRERGCRLALVSNGRPERCSASSTRPAGLGRLFDRCDLGDPRHPEQLKPSPWAWRRLDDFSGRQRDLRSSVTIRWTRKFADAVGARLSRLFCFPEHFA